MNCVPDVAISGEKFKMDNWGNCMHIASLIMTCTAMMNVEFYILVKITDNIPDFIFMSELFQCILQVCIYLWYSDYFIT